MTIEIVHVAVGVIKKNNAIFICKRADEQHQGGLWEFPGGKVEAGESVFVALKRELIEEVGLTIHSSSQLMVIEHDYGDKCVKLDVHVVSNFSGEAHGAEGQPSEWVAITELENYDFPEANAEIIEKIVARYA
ncbi:MULTISPECIES: 8-oxo-dGTP diphosphatase MutT [Pseudoalteromonas]|jgi:8-oxo-dGTP diphosphatase|uniref:8-oxo-dGTP diphosphatase n=1 Tax=Pseudoalteromonas distincta TaxID=77608 RepID=A0ABT9GAR7_9GAMM|nr:MULTISPECIES: 8-oxo-dGTP diphosphatase MutT [Pseudoalteromonas]ALQ09431.1 7,8-dihydro-8-oxoguanine-triphosphatase [Pseudoalteromonas sp. Bsw20308]KHM50211.1 7,8-dihydro-8-oxoguanine-triphosphatase [Pseudoalteromonas elyakovii]KID40940.1 7,8-dihydro-8-oxoguanine-triphosphatase [Pseudoalteromonas distincta]MBB1277899.1 8-oxo-dGTP diphosphatase MutT [Pseudoalteromonas sp. SR43-3]MBB1279997.1 8-oxo-dGTP diphosphatase MutT [Pseudoalteromonas sp. SR41-1]|tara:strand:- start:307 stop:705 length:399 start_codon:yes stop_codon:yes gene_type:complete